MSENEIQVNSKALYELMTAIAHDGATISGYLPLCEILWQNGQSHIWLVASLTKKAGMLTSEPDQACLEFLTEKAMHELDCSQEKKLSRDMVIEYLPAVIQLMPDKVWKQPLNIWNELLVALKDEFGLEIHIKSSDVSVATDPKQEELARFLVDAIGAKWNEKLGNRLESWRGQAEYEWLLAFKDSAQLDIVIDKVKEKHLTDYSLNDPSLFKQFSQMKAFEQRRLLLVRDTQTEDAVWPEIETIEKQKKIIWDFYLPLKGKSKFGVYLSENLVAQIALFEKSSGSFVITEASGILMLLKVKFKQELTIRKAAADHPSELVSLMALLKGSIKLVGDKKAVLSLQWCGAGGKE